MHKAQAAPLKVIPVIRRGNQAWTALASAKGGSSGAVSFPDSPYGIDATLRELAGGEGGSEGFHTVVREGGVFYLCVEVSEDAMRALDPAGGKLTVDTVFSVLGMPVADPGPAASVRTHVSRSCHAALERALPEIFNRVNSRADAAGPNCDASRGGEQRGA